MFFPRYLNSIFLIVLFQAFGFTLPQVVQAQSLRSTFPGRRVGGGTRGECTSRSIIHLVPESSQYSLPLDGQPLIGFIQGPTDAPSPIEVTFRPLTNQPIQAEAQKLFVSLSLDPSAASIVLLEPKFTSPSVIWESAFKCVDTSLSSEFDFVTIGSPPAISLLTRKSDNKHTEISRTLDELKLLCGSNVLTANVFESFGLIDLLTPDWPSVLPVRCL